MIGAFIITFIVSWTMIPRPVLVAILIVAGLIFGVLGSRAIDCGREYIGGCLYGAAGCLGVLGVICALPVFTI